MGGTAHGGSKAAHGGKDYGLLLLLARGILGIKEGSKHGGQPPPPFAILFVKGNSRILGSFSIDNARWRRNKDGRFVAVPLKDKTNANFRNLQGKTYTGNRQGGAVTYGAKVS